MGRSVSYPSGAIVAFRTLEIDDEDDWEWEYECLVEEIIETARSTFPSLEPCDGSRGREDRILQGPEPFLPLRVAPSHPRQHIPQPHLLGPFAPLPLPRELIGLQLLLAPGAVGHHSLDQSLRLGRREALPRRRKVFAWWSRFARHRPGR